MAAKSIYESWRKRPDSATVEKLAEYRAKSLSFSEIGRLWGISRSAVWQIYQKHKVEIDKLIEHSRKEFINV